MKVGDIVRVDYEDHDPFMGGEYHWTGICTWTDGYKFQFLIKGDFDIWTSSDLEVAGARVISGEDYG